MATLVGTQRDILMALNSMLELEFDELDAYGAAITRLQSTEYKARLQSFAGDHERHVNELTTALASMSMVPAPKGDLKAFLTKGKVVIGSLAGDAAILRAMRTNEDDTNAAYQMLVTRSDLPPALTEAIQRSLADERRHHDWIDHVLATAKTQPSASHPGRYTGV